MNPKEPEPNSPSRGQKHICLLFESEVHYQACVADLAKYRAYLIESQLQHPELFPQAFAGGFSFHDTYRSRKRKGLVLRRIRLKQTGDAVSFRRAVLIFIISLSRPLSEGSRNNSFRLRGN